MKLIILWLKPKNVWAITVNASNSDLNFTVCTSWENIIETNYNYSNSNWKKGIAVYDCQKQVCKPTSSSRAKHQNVALIQLQLVWCCLQNITCMVSNIFVWYRGGANATRSLAVSLATMCKWCNTSKLEKIWKKETFRHVILNSRGD